MLEGTYPAPNGWSLKWRTFCDDDCRLYPRPFMCQDCQHKIGTLALYDAEGQRQRVTSGVVTQSHIDRAVRELKARAVAEMQPRLFEMEAKCT